MDVIVQPLWFEWRRPFLDRLAGLLRGSRLHDSLHARQVAASNLLETHASRTLAKAELLADQQPAEGFKVQV